MTILKMKTNFNQKLNSDIFLHISKAPINSVPESKLGQVYQIEVTDQSHPGVKAEMLFFYRFPIGGAVDIYTMPSHGMNAAEFIEWYLKENPTENYETELAVFFYKNAGLNSNNFVH